jgi:hypothetical protein
LTNYDLAKDLGLLTLVGAVVLPWAVVKARRVLRRRRVSREAREAERNLVIALGEAYVSGRGTGHTEAEVNRHRTRNMLRVKDALERLAQCTRDAT